MSLTSDPNDPRLRRTLPSGQQAAYLVLSAEERAKGFVRPLRRSYRHVGVRPTYPIRDLDPLVERHYLDSGYTQFEAYPEAQDSSIIGRFWTQAQLESGCGAVTTMDEEIAATYAREPTFYAATFCCRCRRHVPVQECIWLPDGSPLGS